MAELNNEDRTRACTAYITDLSNHPKGSGVLFYVGGEDLYVFTAAHVVDDEDAIKVTLIKPRDISRDLYDTYITEVPKTQIILSSKDVVTEKGGIKHHSEDYAIIYVTKPASLDLEPSKYLIGEKYRNSPVYLQGYPCGFQEGERPIKYLECMHGTIVVNAADESTFTIRIQESHLNQSARYEELQGISGAPVWDRDDNETSSLLGIISEGYGETILLAKIFTTKAQRIRILMNEYFGITIKHKLTEIPDTDVAGTDYKPIIFDGRAHEKADSIAEKWLKEQMAAIRCSIEDLKLQTAIDDSRAIIEDERFSSCKKDSQKRLMQYLLYCYEIGDLDSEFDALEQEMRERGLLKKYDALRHLSRSFMKKQYRKTISVAEECLADPENGLKRSLVAFAKTFRVLAKAYEEKLTVEYSIGTLLNEYEECIYEVESPEDASLIYQMIGYVYMDRYRNHVNAVRFLNRSYGMGFDTVILESLGAAYYFLGIADATREDETVDYQRIDRKSLYKARECFLIVMGKADSLFWAGSVRRLGVIIYNTFVFLNDNYRVLTIYPDLKKYVTEPIFKNISGEGTAPQIQSAFDFWRDIEMKYARVVAQSGVINVQDYDHLKRTDKLFLDTLALTTDCFHKVENAIATLSVPRMKQTGLDRFIKKVIAEAENNVMEMDRRDRVQIYIQIINLYGRGMTLFGWNKLDKVKRHFARIKDAGDPELLDSMQNFIFEHEAPFNEAVDRFKSSFDKWKNLRAWQELNHLYVRHKMMDQADAMFKELLVDRRELISDEPEYAYRAYIDYIIHYRRDLKDALQCYLDAKEAFVDTDIEGYWELELMLHTNTFNDPERFEIERKGFMERGLITEEQYHRTAFIAYMANLQKERAREHEKLVAQYEHFINPMNGSLILQKEEILFLNWIDAIKPGFLPPPKSMIERRANEVLKQYQSETWHRQIDRTRKNQFDVDRTIAIDAWGLYILAEEMRLDALNQFENVYIPHSTIIRLLEELSKTDNQKIRDIMNFLETSQNVHLESAGFKTQIEVRNSVPYTEMAAVIAIAKEKDCLVILGEPDLGLKFIDKFGKDIIRINEIENLFSTLSK